jgi:hypothetical protein
MTNPWIAKGTQHPPGPFGRPSLLGMLGLPGRIGGWLPGLLLLLVGASQLDAQLPSAARGALLSAVNAPTTLRMEGSARIPGGTTVQGSVAVLGGSLDLAGRVAGDLVVVNGDLRVHPGGRVDGSVRIVGGELRSAPPEWLGGALSVEPAPLRYRIRQGQVELEDAPFLTTSPWLTADLGWGTIRPWLGSAGAYNRVEGLPMEVGAVFETRSRNPLRLDAHAIWRSVSGLELDGENLGHVIRLRQEVGGNGEAGIELTRFSRVVPFEPRGLTDLESSLSTFFLRRDLRDLFEEDGWSVAITAHPVDLPVRLRLEYREDENRTASLGNPWTLRDNEIPWRPLPIVAEGSARSLQGELTVDLRDDPRDPATGWWLEGRFHRRVGGSQRLPVLDPEDPSGPGGDGFRLGGTTSDARLSVAATETLGLATVGRIDVRRYNRLGPSYRLNLRLLAAGPLNGVPLPPQDQSTLGGEGSLPGHPRFAVDCGARTEPGWLPGRGGDPTGPVYPAYGCDGVLLGQVELRGALPFSWSPAEGRMGWETASLLRLEPTWSVFIGAGRGWRVEDPSLADRRVDSGVRIDAGAGLFVGPLGLYWALPLNEKDRGLNFFIRLSNRF